MGLLLAQYHIQMFHHILGEDAKCLSDGEEIGSQELFDTLNKKNIYTGEMEPVDSELKYLEMIRPIRSETILKPLTAVPLSISSRKH